MLDQKLIRAKLEAIILFFLRLSLFINVGTIVSRQNSCNQVRKNHLVYIENFSKMYGTTPNQQGYCPPITHFNHHRPSAFTFFSSFFCFFTSAHMSLALRFGAVASLQESLLGALPRLPQISIRLGLSSLPLGQCKHELEHEHEHQQHMDPRLAELQEQLENSDSQSMPFMIDNGTILKAAPKKRTSYRRKRMKLYMPGNKQVQPLFNIVRCPACGAAKRSHFMCMNCFAEIKTFLKKLKREDGLIKDRELNPQKDISPVDERVIYPGIVESAHARELKKGEWIPKREEAVLYSREHMMKRKNKNRN